MAPCSLYSALLLTKTLCALQHNTLHPTAGLTLELSRFGPDRSLNGRPSGVRGPVGGTLSFGLKMVCVTRDITLSKVSSFGTDVEQVS